MKKVPTIVALCTFATLPLGVVVAGGLVISKPANTEVKAEKEETKTVKLKITGMT